MNDPQLKLTLTIPPDTAGHLVAYAIKLGASFHGLGLVESLPFHKNTPRKTAPLALTHAGAKNGKESIVKRDPELMKKAVEAVLAALAATDGKGLDKIEVNKIYANVRGTAMGIGNALTKDLVTRKGDRVFLKKG